MISDIFIPVDRNTNLFVCEISVFKPISYMHIIVAYVFIKYIKIIFSTFFNKIFTLPSRVIMQINNIIILPLWHLASADPNAASMVAALATNGPLVANYAIAKYVAGTIYAGTIAYSHNTSPLPGHYSFHVPSNLTLESSKDSRSDIFDGSPSNSPARKPIQRFVTSKPNP